MAQAIVGIDLPSESEAPGDFIGSAVVGRGANGQLIAAKLGLVDIVERLGILAIGGKRVVCGSREDHLAALGEADDDIVDVQTFARVVLRAFVHVSQADLAASAGGRIDAEEVADALGGQTHLAGVVRHVVLEQLQRIARDLPHVQPAAWISGHVIGVVEGICEGRADGVADLGGGHLLVDRDLDCRRGLWKGIQYSGMQIWTEVVFGSGALGQAGDRQHAGALRVEGDVTWRDHAWENRRQSRGQSLRDGGGTIVKPIAHVVASIVGVREHNGYTVDGQRADVAGQIGRGGQVEHQAHIEGEILGGSSGSVERCDCKASAALQFGAGYGDQFDAAAQGVAGLERSGRAEFEAQADVLLPGKGTKRSADLPPASFVVGLLGQEWIAEGIEVAAMAGRIDIAVEFVDVGIARVVVAVEALVAGRVVGSQQDPLAVFASAIHAERVAHAAGLREVAVGVFGIQEVIEIQRGQIVGAVAAQVDGIADGRPVRTAGQIVGAVISGDIV